MEGISVRGCFAVDSGAVASAAPERSDDSRSRCSGPAGPKQPVSLRVRFRELLRDLVYDFAELVGVPIGIVQHLGYALPAPNQLARQGIEEIDDHGALLVWRHRRVLTGPTAPGCSRSCRSGYRVPDLPRRRSLRRSRRGRRTRGDSARLQRVPNVLPQLLVSNRVGKHRIVRRQAYPVAARWYGQNSEGRATGCRKARADCVRTWTSCGCKPRPRRRAQRRHIGGSLLSPQ